MRSMESAELGSGMPEPEEVRKQLARILSSPDFSVPERLTAFLTFVVEEALAGRGDRVKAYTIATKVFGRPNDFDSLNDPVIRIEAGRLRRALERYYLKGGASDQILIDIPKGGYAPKFLRRHQEIESDSLAAQASESVEPTPHRTEPLIGGRNRPKFVAAAVGSAFVFAVVAFWAIFGDRFANSSPVPRNPEVSLVVSPFTNLSGPEGGLYAAGISDELLNQLARFKELRIISRDAVLALSGSSQAPLQPGVVKYALEGSVRVHGGELRVWSRLLDGNTNRILWSKVYSRDINRSDGVDIEADIATRVATSVAQPYGAIFTPVSLDAAGRTPAGAEAHLCILRFYQYRKEPTREEHGKTRDCLIDTVTRNPGYSTGWAMLAYLHLDEDRFEFNQHQKAPAGKRRAREAAEQAVNLDPSNVRALQALMTVLFYSREPEIALKIGERALALNPNDTEMLAEFGSRLAQFGERKRGLSMIEEAIERNPNHTRYYTAILAQNYFMVGDNKRALYWIKRAEMKRFSNYHFVSALIFAQENMEQETKVSVREFLRMRPRFFENLEAELATRNYNAEDRRILIEGARRAGFPVGRIES